MDHKVIIPCPNCGKSVSNNKSSLYNNLLLICHNCGFSWYFSVQSSYNTSQGINYAAYNTTPSFTSNKELISKYKTTKDILRPYLNAPIHVSLRPHVPQRSNSSGNRTARSETKEREVINKDREYKPSGEKYTPKTDVNTYLNAKPKIPLDERKPQSSSSGIKVVSSPVTRTPKTEVKPRETITLKKEVINSSINTNPPAPKRDISSTTDKPRATSEVSTRKVDEERVSRNTNTSSSPKLEREVTTSRRTPLEERKRESNHQVRNPEVRTVKEQVNSTNKIEIPKPSNLDSLYREKENIPFKKEPQTYENITNLYKPEKAIAQTHPNLNLTAELKKDSHVGMPISNPVSIKQKNNPIMRPEFTANSRGISKTIALKKPALIKKPNFSLDKDLKEPLKDALTNILNSYEYAVHFLKSYFRSLLRDTQKLLQFISYVFLGIMTLSLLILANRLKINSLTDLQINSNIIKYHETKTSDLEPDYKITKSKDDDVLAINNLDNAFKDEKAKKNVFLNVEKNNNVTASKVLNNPTPDIEEGSSSENMESLDTEGKVKVDNSFKGNLTSVLLKAKQINQNFLSDLKINQKNANWIRNDNKNTLFEVTAQIENNDFKNTFKINKLQVVFTNVQGQIVYKRELTINQIIQNLSITDIQLRIKDVPFTAYNAYLFIDSKEKIN